MVGLEVVPTAILRVVSDFLYNKKKKEEKNKISINIANNKAVKITRTGQNCIVSIWKCVHKWKCLRCLTFKGINNCYITCTQITFSNFYKVLYKLWELFVIIEKLLLLLLFFDLIEMKNIAKYFFFTFR